MKYYWMLGFLVLTLLALQFSLWGDNGVLRWVELTDMIETQTNKNAGMRERNEALKMEVVGLKEGQDAIENIAREEANMIKKDETFYRVIQLPPKKE